MTVAIPDPPVESHVYQLAVEAVIRRERTDEWVRSQIPRRKIFQGLDLEHLGTRHVEIESLGVETIGCALPIEHRSTRFKMIVSVCDLVSEDFTSVIVMTLRDWFPDLASADIWPICGPVSRWVDPYASKTA